jgi:transglutaminase-like putative cysteine protease
MPYNWEGDRILQDTAIKRKRYVIGEKRSITADIREWISFQDNIIMKNILRELRDHHGLPATKNPGDFDKRAMVVWKYIAEEIKYVYDIRKYKKGDFWLFPPETYQIRKGDCEDGSFLLVSLLIAGGISPFCVRVVLGELCDERNGSRGGHCWPVYKNELGGWCILESTLDTVPSHMPGADVLTGKGQVFRYMPMYCFNDHHLWEIFPPDAAEGEKPKLDKYFRARRRMADMTGTRSFFFRINQNTTLTQKRKGAKKG